jgi:hypothetical protein
LRLQLSSKRSIEEEKKKNTAFFAVTPVIQREERLRKREREKFPSLCRLKGRGRG